MAAAKKQAYFRFYGNLTDFLPAARRQSEVRYAFRGRPAVKDAIEAQGVPHPEVDLILANGTTASFDRQLAAGDRVSVYPWIRRLDRPDAALRPPWPTPLCFVCDVHLGRLARYLRMLGFDTRYTSDRTDAALARLSDEEDRILLTRDRDLLKRSRVKLGAYVREEIPRRQLADIVHRFQVDRGDVTPLSRCLECNTLLEPAGPDDVADQVPTHARRVSETFRRCPDCETVYWDGTHAERMHRLMREVFDGAVSE